MSRESKIINATHIKQPVEEIVRHYESFGWELLALNGTQITMTRETQNAVYPDLVKFQAKYEAKMKEFNGLVPPQPPVKPEPVNPLTCLITFVCFIIPCVIYSAFKIMQFNEYKEKVATYESKLNAYNKERMDLSSEIEQILQDSRATFFGKQV